MTGRAAIGYLKTFMRLEKQEGRNTQVKVLEKCIAALEEQLTSDEKEIALLNTALDDMAGTVIDILSGDEALMEVQPASLEDILDPRD